MAKTKHKTEYRAAQGIILRAEGKSVEEIIDEDPQAFGYLKGRWVLRDISRQLQKEGIEMHWTSVARMLDELKIGLASPKLRAPGSIKKNYAKRAEVRRYKRIAPALLKKTSSSAFKTRNGPNFSRKSSAAGRAEVKRATSKRLVTPSA